MAENGGLGQLLQVMSELRDLSRERELATALFRLLGACAKLRVNRRALVRLGAIDVALRQLRLAFAAESDAHVAAALALLPIVEAVIGEANRMERFQSSGNLGRSASIADAMAAEGLDDDDEEGVVGAAGASLGADDESRRARRQQLGGGGGGAERSSAQCRRVSPTGSSRCARCSSVSRARLCATTSRL
jgi:type II secretory pathway pseudopilin PulG